MLETKKACLIRYSLRHCDIAKTGSPRHAREDGGGGLPRSVRDEGGLPRFARSDECCHCERSEAIHCSVAKNWIATLRSR